MDIELRLDKLLAAMGFGTRTEVKKMIKRGLVTVDTLVEKDPAVKVNPARKTVQVGGEAVLYRQFVYLMLNKPQGVISATEDGADQTVLDLLSPQYRTFSPFPVGRLDKDTEGLLLLTNDGKLGHLLTSPRRKVAKTYYALVRGEVTDLDKDAFARGVILDDGYKTLPAQLNILKSGQRSEIELVIYEGKYHQVKRMFQAREKEVLFLRRLKMGPLTLDESLAPGEYRELTQAELDSLADISEKSR